MQSVKRVAVAAIVVALALAGIYIGARQLLGTGGSSAASSRCTFGDYTTDTGQASVAATMTGVVLQRGLPERAAVLTITAAWQESKLRNITSGAGDLDSVGVLQQRPSQGWGTEQELADVAIATNRFLDALVRVPGWDTEPAAAVIQAVQISADGRLYARHEAKSAAMAAALTGATPAGVSCTFPPPDQIAPAPEVARLVASELPVAAPQVVEGTVSVPGASWATTAWFIANADRLGIDSVAHAGRQWSRSDGWREDPAAAESVVVATLFAKSD